MIDWSKLKTYEDDRRRSFEELCFQIADRLFGNKGKLTSIDDTGGGDGVEFFLTFSDGSEWGWQAKFFGDKRLTSSRKSKIKKSLEKSISNHPKLTKWFLCTRFDLTTKDNGERAWFEGDLQNLAAGVKLEHWGASKIGSFLSRPSMTGLRSYFYWRAGVDG